MAETVMPVVFSGHGSPMVALEDNDITHGMEQVGKDIIARYGKPKAILAISAHWFADGTFVQTAPQPRQVYDMYGFPPELYALEYPVKGCAELSTAVQDLLKSAVTVNNSWGIDHGVWTVLVHMFPKADIPVVELSVSRRLSAREGFAIGQQLQPLRKQGYLLFGSGNIVHNLSRVQWDNEGGTPAAERFNSSIVQAVLAHDTDTVLDYESLPDGAYAVPTPEHYLPLAYCLGAAGSDEAHVFNNVCNLGSMAMTGFVWEH